MTLGSGKRLHAVSNMSGLKLHFEGLDDEGSKESNDLTMDAGFHSTDNSYLSHSQKNTDLLTDVSKTSGSLQHTGNGQDANDANEKKKGGWPKGRKRKRIMKDLNAPKQPLTGYVRFLNNRRDVLRQENPKSSFTDITRMLAAEWAKLPTFEKQKYLNDAEKDKERYLAEMEAYKKTEAYKIFKIQQEKKLKGDLEENETSHGTNGSTLENEEDDTGTFDIPIFTEEFLDHNKAREADLRQLRKQTTELEEQNAILSKHIDNMKQAIEKLEVEAVQQRNTNVALVEHLDALRTALTSNFSSIPLPGTNEVPTMDTIDTYMTKLHNVILDSPQDNESLIATVRDIVGRLNIEGDKL